MKVKDQLIGSWNLLAVYGRSNEGDHWDVYGKEAKGMLIYTPDGYMSAVLMGQGRPKFASGDPLNPTPEELEAAFKGFDAYCGTYTLNAQENIVTHHVEASRLPDWEGSDQVRYFTLEQDRLSIYTDPIPAGNKEWILYAEWKRR